MVFFFPRNTALFLLIPAMVACALPPGGRSLISRLHGPDYPDPETDLRGAAGAILSRAIQFDTSNPPGNERALARYLVDIFYLPDSTNSKAIYEQGIYLNQQLLDKGLARKWKP